MIYEKTEFKLCSIRQVELSRNRLDINKNGKVDMYNVARTARQFMTDSSPNWIPQTDINEDLKVDIKGV